MCAPKAKSKASARRGTVMVMVVGVLAMLFIIGSTLLIVGRFERQTGQISMTARSMEAVSQGILEPVIIALRRDLVGSNDKAYLRDNWNNTLVGEDYGDYPGFIAANSPRNGDLLLSSLEPYFDPGGPGTADDRWRLFAVSWPSDFLSEPNASRKNFNIFITDNPLEDADGDGIRDAAINDILGFSDTFGGTYHMSLRVIPHNAMVWLNRLTHPTLLAQVIHPTDLATVSSMDALRTAIKELALGPTDENRLRRRFMLPPLLPEPDSGNYKNVASVLVQNLAITTGYADPAKPTGWLNQPVNRWTMFRPSDKEQQDWERRIEPTYNGLTDPAYNAARDTYDRRHLITTESSDDALRPQREEKRLKAFTFTLGVAPDTVTFNLENIISPVDASLVTPASADPNRPPLAYGVMDYGPAGGSVDHVFNKDGLRTQFSLRDVLEPNGQASYRRATQLTAYFLAMIQHTTVPGSNVPNPSDLRNPTPAELAEQLRTAMQLAVNTIDFADADQIPTYLEFDNGAGLGAKVVGVEKQPFITEAYAKFIYKADGEGAAWDTGTDLSIYAVELYNPYDTSIQLGTVSNPSFRIRVTDASGTGTVAVDVIDPTIAPALPQSIPPHQYYLVVNTKADESKSGDDFLTPVSPGKIVENSALKLDDLHRFVRLYRSGTWKVDRDHPNGVLSTDPIEIDRLAPIDDPAWATAQDSSKWLPANPQNLRNPRNKSDIFVWDCSLQRHKEPNPERPVHWHFTLSRQMVFPLKYQEDKDEPTAASDPYVYLLDPSDKTRVWCDSTRPPQHNLLGTAPSTTDFANVVTVGATTRFLTNQGYLAAEFAGQRLVSAVTASVQPEITVKPFPIAPFPVLVADRGVHPNTGGTMAFPTTGTLLLVTRYAHLPMQGIMTEDKPLSVAAMDFVVRDFDALGNLIPLRSAAEQILQLDNGHLPVFDTAQACLDDKNSRFGGLPWGQLAFEYFTALPMEELARDLGPLTPGAQRLMDSTDYLNHYGAVGGADNWGDWTKSRFLNYPVMMPVAQTLGPRVQGRIGIGSAPWWVLDGLPVLPDFSPTDSVNVNPAWTYNLACLPVPEIEAERLDPYIHTADPKFMAGAWFVHRLIDEKYSGTLPQPLSSTPNYYVDPPAEMPSISPRLAQYMVSYREQRPVGAVQAVYADRIGFATTGEICNVLTKVQLGDLKNPKTGADIKGPSLPLDEWRRWADDNNERPFSYLGYLQLVAPIVRMQDWMTVKNHVFTIYATIQSTGQPPVTVRTQVTVDRTRCLYNPSELPERITETPPISYYNMMDD